MKSLLLTSSFPPRVGGRELYLHSIFSRLPAEEVTVLTIHEKEAFSLLLSEETAEFDQKSDMHIHRVGQERLHWFLQGRRKRLRWFASLARLGLREKIDIVHCGVALPDGMSGWLLKKVLGWPYIVFTYAKEITETFSMERLHRYRQRTLLEAERVVTISQYTRQELIRLGVEPDRIIIAPPGVDADYFQPNREAGEHIRSLYGLGEKPILLTVARLIPRKGHDRVIEAMPFILQQVPEAIYVIVGEGPDEERLRKLVQSVGVGNRVAFIGSVPAADLLGWYNAADLMVMPNRRENGDVEGFGIVFLEANACGKPVIGGRSGGVMDAIDDGESGCLVDPYDSQAVAKAAIRLLADPALAHRMGARGREWAKKFSWERAARQVQTLAAEVVSDCDGSFGIGQAMRSLQFFARPL